MTHYCKNGDIIRVGGVYVIKRDEHPHSVIKIEDGWVHTYSKKMEYSLSRDVVAARAQSELPRDIDGYYLWQGKECPVPGEWEIEANGLGGLHICHAKHRTWGNISRFRVTSTGEDVQEVEPYHVSPHGYTTREWITPAKWRDTPLVVDPNKESQMKEPRTAEAFLHQAASLMAERGKEYDKPTGERSMGNTIVAFNAITGRDLSEAEGWLLMSLVKRVRQYSTPNYHKDSAEDAVAYAALEAEALERGE